MMFASSDQREIRGRSEGDPREIRGRWRSDGDQMEIRWRSDGDQMEMSADELEMTEASRSHQKPPEAIRRQSHLRRCWR